MTQECSLHPEWACISSGSHSPASSLESYNVSPAYRPSEIPTENVNNYLQAHILNMDSRQTQETMQSSRRTRCKMVGTQRHSASEREKMRMRDLSKALHNLRRYLPPSVAPAGRNLTKIETLRLTIRYISYLSQLLGINGETIQSRIGPQTDAHIPYPKTPERCEQVTYNQYHQIQNQSHSSAFNEQSHEFCKRISPVQPESVPMETSLCMTSSYDRGLNIVADFSLSSPYCSRFTHSYQVADYYCQGAHVTISPSLKEGALNR